MPADAPLSLRDLGRAKGHADPTPYGGLTLEDLPADHPIRQEVAHLTARVALLEGRIDRALERLTRAAEHTFRRTPHGELIESVGCRLTGRSGYWWPPSSPQPH